LEVVDVVGPARAWRDQSEDNPRYHQSQNGDSESEEVSSLQARRYGNSDRGSHSSESEGLGRGSLRNRATVAEVLEVTSGDESDDDTSNNFIRRASPSLDSDSDGEPLWVTSLSPVPRRAIRRLLSSEDEDEAEESEGQNNSDEEDDSIPGPPRHLHHLLTAQDSDDNRDTFLLNRSRRRLPLVIEDETDSETDN
jgi:hypothetical protein